MVRRPKICNTNTSPGLAVFKVLIFNCFILNRGRPQHYHVAKKSGNYFVNLVKKILKISTQSVNLHTLIINDIWYMTIWQFDWQVDILTFWQFDILTFWHFDILTIWQLHGWQFHIVDNLEILTFWLFDNFTLLTIWHCWQFHIFDNFTLLTISHC